MVADAADAGVRFILPGGLTLKPGRSKDGFMACLERHFPELVPKYAEFYGNRGKYGQPDTGMTRGLGVRDWRNPLREFCMRYGVKLEYW